MRLSPTAKAVVLQIPIIGVVLGIIAFVLPEFLASFELGLTKILSLKVGGLLLIAVSATTLIFRFHISEARKATEKLIRGEFHSQRELLTRLFDSAGKGD